MTLLLVKGPGRARSLSAGRLACMMPNLNNQIHEYYFFPPFPKHLKMTSVLLRFKSATNLVVKPLFVALFNLSNTEIIFRCLGNVFDCLNLASYKLASRPRNDLCGSDIESATNFVV